MKDQMPDYSGPREIPMTSAEWCARMHAADVTETDRELFKRWLQESPEHKAEYGVCELSWRLSQGLANAPELAAALLSVRGQAALKGHRRRWLYALAASVTVVCVVALMFLWTMQGDVYQTAVGERRKVALTDGSQVELNTATTIDVELGNSERHIELRRGEAFFTVASDVVRPFIVNAGSGEIWVVGTQFNVRVDGDKTLVAVLEGQVRAVVDNNDIDLIPGEQVVIKSGRQLEKTKRADMDRLVSWRRGKILFNNDSLANVAKEVNRYLDQKIIINDNQVSRLKLTGVFKTGDLNAVLFALRETHGLRAEEIEQGLVIYKP